MLLSQEKSDSRWTYDQLFNATCNTYGIKKEILFEPGKGQPAAEARAVSAYLVQENEQLSLTVLGTHLNRDISGLSRAGGPIREKIVSVKDILDRISKNQA